MGLAPRPTAASSVIATDESTRASSSIARQNDRKSAPCPPYRSGNGSPKSPSSPICLTMSRGNSSAASISSARGATTSSAKRRTVRRNASCSSVSAKSTGRSVPGRSALPGFRHRDRQRRQGPAGAFHGLPGPLEVGGVEGVLPIPTGQVRRQTGPGVHVRGAGVELERLAEGLARALAIAQQPEHLPTRFEEAGLAAELIRRRRAIRQAEMTLGPRRVAALRGDERQGLVDEAQ